MRCPSNTGGFEERKKLQFQNARAQNLSCNEHQISCKTAKKLRGAPYDKKFMKFSGIIQLRRMQANVKYQKPLLPREKTINRMLM
ncbi:unnamed protein product [Caenorhabditis brenneri]